MQSATGDDAFHADDTLTVTDGSIRITDSYEGLEALHVVVSGGDIELYASDDGINAAGGTDSSGTGGRGGDRFGGPGMNGGMSSSSSGTIVISGGSIRIEAHGDGIDANGTLTISGGYVAVWGPTQGDTATLDYDVSGVITAAPSSAPAPRHGADLQQFRAGRHRGQRRLAVRGHDSDGHGRGRKRAAVL